MSWSSDDRMWTTEGMCSGLHYNHWGFTSVQIEDLVQATGASNGEAYGFTYSDLTQRLLPRLVLDAFPTDPVSPIRALAIARGMRATPPFEDPAGWTAWSTDG